MLQDATRTGTYYWAIMNNRQDFEGKVVVDVGAGTGILSLFAAQVRIPHSGGPGSTMLDITRNITSLPSTMFVL